MNDAWERMGLLGLEIIAAKKLAVARMEQFNELVSALRRCHTALIATRFVTGIDNDHILNEIIAQAEKILLKVEKTDL
jgi:hypothetical protein